MIALRPYQTKVVDDIAAAIAAGHKRILVVAPTGSGKTVIGSEIIRRYSALLQSSLVIAHRREIIQQTSQKLYANEIRHGIILAGFAPRPLERVQVASIQTMGARDQRPTAHLLMVDEAHHARAKTYLEIIGAYPDAILIGLTATPCRGDGRGLGNIFEVLIEAPQIPQLIELGHLVKSRVFAPVRADVAKGVETRQGDYVISQLSRRMNTSALVGDVVEHWHRFGERRRTVAFACDVAHSLHIRDEFIKAGVRCGHIDGSTPKDERDATLAQLASGRLEIISNCMVLTEGWDMPEVGCCILARPTKQMGLYRQMVGRVLRPAEGKPDSVILDHSGAVYRHGRPEDVVEWSLDLDKRATAPEHEKRQANPATALLECTQCGSVRTGGQPCPCCGFLPQRPAQGVRFADGDLGLVARSGKTTKAQIDPVAFIGELKSIADDRNYKRGWIAHKYKEKFGEWPRADIDIIPARQPSLATLGWVRSRQIAFAKATGWRR
jgi:superfamily II DNA or RNA helicase